MFELAQKVAARNRSLLNRDRRRPNADPYVIALAMLRQGRLSGRLQVIVTEEHDRPGRIPGAARSYGIVCIDVDS